MLGSGSVPPWVAALAVVIVLSTITAAAAIARAAARRARRDAWESARALTLLVAGYVESRVAAAELGRAARTADSGVFWTALEYSTLRLRRAERARLSRVLGRSRHEAAERRALREDSPWRSELAARRLSLLCSPTSRRALRASLERGPEIVTYAAAVALARWRDARALRWILAHPQALRSRRPRAWTALLRAFGRGAAPVLAETLERGPGDPRLERAVIETLGLWRLRSARIAIQRRLAHRELEVRVAAARALGRLEAEESANALIAALEDGAWQVRCQAAWALGRARVAAAVPALSLQLTDRSWWVRRHAAYALKELGEEGVAALRRTAEASSDPYARDIAVEALETDPSAFRSLATG